MDKPRQIPVYSRFRTILLEYTGLVKLIEPARWTNIYAKHLEQRIRDEIGRTKLMYPASVKEEEVIEGFKKLEELAQQDTWYKSRLTSMEILYRNFGRLIQK